MKIQLITLCLIVMAASCQQNERSTTATDDVYYPSEVEIYTETAKEATDEEMVAPIIIQHNVEEVAEIAENSFHLVAEDPLSTFSIDVDNASYTNIRRMLNNNQIPNPNAVRIEEMVNYFDYKYPQPSSNKPFAIQSEVVNCPWKENNKIVSIGLQGTDISIEEMASNNLVFLLDVSGSMNQANKLPLLKKAFNLLIDQLRPHDYVSIVTYAGNNTIVLNPTSCKYKNKIKDAMNRLEAGGSTAGADGIVTAYALANEVYNNKGNNRVLLATDGDFNVGISGRENLVSFIEKKRDEGIDLTVLGFGDGNYKDASMEALANNGNGNYFYLDSENEAQNVLVDRLSGTLMTIAKDVKIQVEFNPAYVSEYRLIGYETRALENKDFNDSQKDAGELGAGHTVTALYEITTHVEHTSSNLKYQSQILTEAAYKSGEIMTIKLKYKHPKTNEVFDEQHLVKQSRIKFSEATANSQKAICVAAFGLLLRKSEFKESLTYNSLQQLLLNLETTSKIEELKTLVEKANAINILAQN